MQDLNARNHAVRNLGNRGIALVAIVVVGGSGRGVGKTALVCGLLAALPEFCWIAVKIAGHAHRLSDSIWEQKAGAGQGSGTARYLAAGAHRSLLMTALGTAEPVTTEKDELGQALQQLMQMQGPGVHLIFESNRILQYVEPDLCLAIAGGPERMHKPSFAAVVERMDAMVVHADRDRVVAGATPAFHLADFERISPQMLAWLRDRLSSSGHRQLKTDH